MSLHSLQPFLRRGPVDDKLGKLAEEVSLQLTADRYGGDVPGRYIEHVEHQVRDLVEEALAGGEVESYQEWLGDLDPEAGEPERSLPC